MTDEDLAALSKRGHQMQRQKHGGLYSVNAAFCVTCGVRGAFERVGGPVIWFDGENPESTRSEGEPPCSVPVRLGDGTRQVIFAARGRMFGVRVADPVNVVDVMTMALYALDDPRVDAVIAAFGGLMIQREDGDEFLIAPVTP